MTTTQQPALALVPVHVCASASISSITHLIIAVCPTYAPCPALPYPRTLPVLQAVFFSYFTDLTTYEGFYYMGATIICLGAATALLYWTR